ncbi:NUDIX domain-containing protein [Pseudosulfitobacter sp. SM2401]|uniref:NUDIX hydrolase n=1 Tax=Pseudosulfitobacter sp. SM2401 TaxID=3350098 RepID=UPI0036F42B84
MTDRPKVAALAVVLREGHVLLVKRKNEPDAGLWGFPGGHVELGETGLDAAARELHEETGVIATSIAYLTNLDIITHDPDGGIAFHFLLAAVLCNYQSGTPRAMDDAQDADWIRVQDVESKSIALSQNVDDVLRLALAYQRGH